MNQKATIEYFDKLKDGSPPVTVVFHARGNQGAVAATEILIILYAKLVEMGFKFDGTSAPIFGAAKEGEPIRIYCRNGSEKVEVFYTPIKLDVIVIVDPTIARNVLLQGTHKDTIFLVNTNETPEDTAHKMKLGKHRVITVDATRIAKEEIKAKRSHQNTTMLGAFAHIFPFLPLDLFKQSIEAKLEEKGHKVVEVNLRAFDRGFAEALEFDGREKDIPWEEIAAPKKLAWYEIPIGFAMPANGNFALNKTGSWRTERPVLDLEKCINCLVCVKACNDLSILTKIGTDGTEKVTHIDYDHCKGCGECARVCPITPIKAITMIPEAEAKK
jgi:2-oxoacid:acceptor oxidoreductase gamma subunit (pyruvate/2-ketoisovalerate family)/2-oxoacid:acceptor oxidoreductase delta subunit (pyruvate/2-ketoisovalerate family)